MNNTAEEDDTPTAPQHRCVQHAFHFVSEAPVRGLKPDQRHAIRSHVMRRYKQEQRRSQIATVERRRESHDDQRLALTPATSTSSDLLGSKQVFLGPRRESLPTASGVSDSSPRGRQIASLQISSQRRCLGDPSRPFYSTSQTSTPQGMVVSPRASYSSGLSVLDPSEPYCLVCGAPQAAWVDRTGDGVSEKDWPPMSARVMRQGLAGSNPLELLGAGRVDPFQSSPAGNANPYSRELMDHAITYLLPGLLPETSSHEEHPAAKVWFTSGLQNPMLFHALVFAGSIHLDFLRCSTIYPNKPAALWHKLIVIEKLKDALSDFELASKDEIILAILILSSHETMEISEGRRNPFNPPLKDVQWLNIYSAIKYVPEHMKAVMELVSYRGGLENIKMYGLAETIATGDLIAATNALSMPILPLLQSARGWVDRVVSWAKSLPRSPAQRLGRGFLTLQGHGIPDDAMEVFQAIGATTMAIDDYLQGKPAGPTLGAIAKIRTALQHRLLSLPPASDVTDMEPGTPSIYEPCRLSALIYSISVTFPVLNSHALLQILVQRLQASLLSSGIERGGPELSHAYLWMLVLGGIASLDRPERAWFVLRLQTFAATWGPSRWEAVEPILHSFLWLESACGLGGRLLWMEVRGQQSYLGAYQS